MEDHIDNYKGLSTREVLNSRKIHGTNEINPPKKDGIIKKLLSILKEPMFLLLVIAASIYFIVGEISDGLIMIASIVGIWMIDFFQSQKTDKALSELNKLTALNIKVLRNGRVKNIDSREVVVGDIVLIEEGDKIPADGVVLESNSLSLNESLLTGESDVVYKSTKEDDKNHFKHNYCYSGTSVTSGTGILKITAVGKDTEIGNISESLKKIKENKSPLIKQTNKLVKICAIISATLFVLVIIANFFDNSNLEMHERIIKSLIAGVTIAMATIPEEIPVIVTVFLALGAWDLAKHKTLTRNMRAIETLGSVTVLCTDKTGTLTENHMVVENAYAYSEDFVRIAYLSCPTVVYDPMEIAIKNYCEKNTPAKLKPLKLLYEYFFTNETKMTGQVWQNGPSKLLCAKGAYESILPLCNLPKEDKKDILEKIRTFSGQGYRVLAVAKNNKISEIPKKISQTELEFVGLIALEDPPRNSIKSSLETCKNAGVRVIMITGDNGETAKGIAKKIGLEGYEDVVTGAELEKMSASELKKAVQHVGIFARVYPNHKTRIVEALQKNKEIVAMTGDGVNDAPALKKADIGIAMGKRGTSVAKESADLILMDDQFSTITTAILNGRTIYQNIRRSISYIFAIHVPVALLALVVPTVGLPNLLIPVHVVMLELIIDPTSSIIFQRIKPNKNIMQKPPRSQKEPIITIATAARTIIQGLAIFSVVFGVYCWSFINSDDHLFSTTMAYATLVTSFILISHQLTSKELTIKNFFTTLKDKISVSINLIMLLILMAVVYVPFFNKLANTTPISLSDWGKVILLAVLAIIPFDILKIIYKIHSKISKKQ
ncbi:cation-translocating P-type ATPase [Candidatus Saccharibacteria bacterium]|nr:cation-translocating P-type ATPase [Candidatus Saccharibacteria bacterium]